MKNNYVSVIIPTYNRCFCINEAIESVLAQSYKDFELIVVDDGSTDNTLQNLSVYEGKIKTIPADHRGPSAARNRGIHASKGNWIAFLDSDDLWLPDKLEKQILFFSNNPEVFICQTEEIWLRNGKRVNPRKKHKKYSGWIFDQCLPLCIVSPSAVMIHRTVFEKVGLFDESMLACEDYDLWLRIAPHFPIFLIKEFLTIKKGGHPDQQSRKVPALDRLRIQAICKALENGSLSPSQHDQALEELKIKCLIYGQGCLKRGRQEEGRKYLGLPEDYL